MSPLVVFILFFVFLLIAIPISVSLGLVVVLPGVFDPSFTASASYVIRSMFGGIDSFPLLAVPMFILSGIIMARGGISKRLFDLFSFFTYSIFIFNIVRVYNDLLNSIVQRYFHQ